MSGSEGLDVGVWSLGFGVTDLGFRLQGFECRVQGLRFGDGRLTAEDGLGLRVQAPHDKLNVYHRFGGSRFRL